MDYKEVLQGFFVKSTDQQRFDTHIVKTFGLSRNFMANQQINNILHHMDRLQGGLARIFGKSTDQQRFDTHIVKKFGLATNFLANQQINNILHHMDGL